MNIIVLVKQVPDPEKKVGMTEEGTVDRARSVPIMNPFDAYALEAALTLKDKYRGKITVITMGPPSAEEVLKEAVSMGADNVVLLSDKKMAASDTLVTALTLSKAIEKIGDYDMVMCGMQAIDGDTAQVGPQIAERLGIPQVTFVEEIDIDEEMKAVFKRVIEGGYEMLCTSVPVRECPLLVTITNTAKKPRMPTLPGKFKARKLQVPVWSLSDIEPEEDLHRKKYGMRGSPTRVKKIERPKIDKEPCRIFEGECAEEKVQCLIKCSCLNSV
ncbi:MAG: electron transfer flavoprotein subunit beta/FixA family protein [Vulcanimicrobiota bacterium]